MIKNVPISLSGLMNIKLGQATLGSYNNLNRRHWPAIFLIHLKGVHCII